jgi:hypothetical protein
MISHVLIFILLLVLVFIFSMISEITYHRRKFDTVIKDTKKIAMKSLLYTVVLIIASYFWHFIKN